MFSIRCVTFPPALAVTGVARALMGESKLCLPVCHRQWITWTKGTTAARAWRRFTTLVHTDFIYSAHRCLCFFLLTGIDTQHIAHFIIPHCVSLNPFVVLTKNTSSPNLQILSHPLLLFCSTCHSLPNLFSTEISCYYQLILFLPQS